MSSDNPLPSAVPIYAHLSDIEVVGDLKGKYSTTRPDHFVKVYLDDKRVMKSEMKPRFPALRWEKDYHFLIHPSSTMKIVLYRKGRTCIKHLVGAHFGKVTDLLENNAPLDIKDQIGTGLASKIKINLCLVSDSKTEKNFKSFMDALDANVSRLDGTTDQVPDGVSTTLGNALQLTKNIMDVVSDAHPILRASWTLMSAVYRAVEQVKLSDEKIRVLAESLRELLGVTEHSPKLLVIPGTTDVIEEIGRTSLKVASLIHEYTKSSFTRRTLNGQLSDDMESRITQCQKSCRDLKEKLETRRNMTMHDQVARVDRKIDGIKDRIDANNSDTQRNLEIIKETQLDIKATIITNDSNSHGNLEIVKDTQLEAEIKKWLSAPDSSQNYHEARERHQTDTCSWFLDGTRFLEWQVKADFLWIKGNTGCGKTILCSSIINKIMELRKEKKSIACAYFFFDGRDSQKDLQLHNKLIRSLILQLAQQCDDIPTALVELYGQDHQQPSTASLQDTLHRIIGDFYSTYIVIDSLDECTERDKMLPWIREVISQKIRNLHLVVASRPERDIIDMLQPLDLRCVDLAEEVDHDIAIYLDQQLAAMDKWDKETRTLIKSKLIVGAQGMFRWVALQVTDLKKCSDQYSAMRRLDSLPKGLHETYDRILQKIDEIDRTDSKTILQWLCFSVRPITLKEISEAIAVNFDVEDGPQYMPSRRYWDSRDILKKCPGLIAESEAGTIKLAHFSVKEYLLSEHLLTGTISSFHLAEEISHAIISQTCLAYLLQFDIYKSTFESSPLAPYAAEHWIFHAQSGGIDYLKPKPFSESARTLALATKLFMSEVAFTNWVRMWDLDMAPDTYYMESANRTDIAAPLYYAAHPGLQRLLQNLLEHTEVNVQGGRYGSVLQVASYRGHVPIVKLLLEKGADVNAQGGKYGNALQAASYWGDKEIVKLLMERGADVNAQGGRHGTALQAASYAGKQETVRLLLEKGADVNARSRGQLGSALQAASFEGHNAIVELLMENGADINARGGQHGTALQAASYGGKEAIVRLLLEKGAEIDAQEGMYGSALQAASYRADEAIVKLLLENGANVHAQAGNFGNALQVALYKGYDAVAKLLLDKGADVNAQPGPLGSALQAAAYKGNETTVKLLLEKGSDVNAQGGQYGTALQAASLEGHETIMKLLLDKGANVNAQGGALGSALQAASFQGNETTVKLLLDKGANVNVQGGRFGNALQAASHRGHKRIAKLLQEHRGAIISTLP